MIPKIITAFIFILSVFYFQDLIYFYKSLFLLCLPLLYDVLLYIIIHLSDCNNKYFGEHLIFVESKKKGVFKVEFVEITPDFPDAINVKINRNNKELLKWFAYNYYVYTNIKNFTIKLEKIEVHYKPYENILIYSCYIIGWLFLLFKII